MKKKFLTMMFAALTAAALLTACGGKKEANTPATTVKAETEAPTTKAETTAPASDGAKKAESEASEDGEMVSDETFKILQDNFALMLESHDAVRELYNSDEIAANADIEEVMNEAADVINQMGEITQDSITEEDAVILNDAIGDILDALVAVIDQMELVGEDVVSNETFAALQENYNILAEAYNVVAEAYNSDQIEANADIENTLNQAREIIEQMGEITQENITEKDAEELTDAMIQIIDVLDLVVDAME